MDATRLIAALAATASLTAGCSGGSSIIRSANTNGRQCVERVVPNSFLIEWSNVPPQYEDKKLSPTSKITRFSLIEQELLEAQVINPNKEKILSAEHEFVVQKLEINLNACSTPVSWGPNDIQAPEAWAFTGKKGEGVTVAVIDSGLDITHPLIASQLWTNFNEVPNNGIDDDGNGFKDDVNGYDFYDGTGNVQDSNGHGTHVSGIIAGQSGSLGFTGIAPKSKVMPLKFIGSDGIGNVGAAIAAIQYAYFNGAKVINASWGGDDCSDMLKKEIQTAVSHGTVFVNAAGNNGKDITIFPEWPAAYQVPGKITVGAMNSGQILSTFSNYGALVDLAAPGEGILSLKPGNQLCGLNGTSMATPFVSGVAALLLSSKPSLIPTEIINTLNSTVITGRYGVRTAGKVNALRALQSVMP